ncbi:hypothetical protein TKK_0005343 [Trichogramma kaykai]
MDSSDIFNCAVRIKQEPNDVSFTENNYELIDRTLDIKNIKRLQEYDEMAKPQEGLKIIFECRDVKPDTGLLVVEKIENYSENNLEIINTIKEEATELVKKELFHNNEKELNHNSNCELSEQNEKRRVEKKSIYKHRLKIPIDKVNSNISCNICVLKFATKSHLNVHNDTKHRGIRHTCNKVKQEPSDVSLDDNEDYQTEFPQLMHKNPIQSIKQEYDEMPESQEDMEIVFECKDLKPNQNLLVEKINDYSQNNLQNMNYSVDYKSESSIKIESVCKVKEEENSNFECEPSKQNNKRKDKKKSHCKSRLKMPNDAGNIDKSNLKKHIESRHNGITHACVICGKKFSNKSNLKKHFKRVHNDILHECDICGKQYENLSSLQQHVKSSHPSNIYTCNECGKSFSQKNNLKMHIDVAHR